jgi:hypothetical protein
MSGLSQWHGDFGVLPATTATYYPKSPRCSSSMLADFGNQMQPSGHGELRRSLEDERLSSYYMLCLGNRRFSITNYVYPLSQPMSHLHSLKFS